MRPMYLVIAASLLASPLHAQQSTKPATKAATQPAAAGQPATQPALSKDQQTKQDALVKGNPKLKEAIDAIEANGGRVNSWGNTDEAGMKAAGAKPSGKSTTGGNKNAAAAAYKRKDYQAALQHYKALAAEGDTEAQVMLGIMHEKGEGVDQDPAAAYAWYGRAANQGDPVAREIVRDMNDKDQMDDAEIDKAGQKYEEIAQELDEPAAAEGAGKQFQEIKEETNVNTEIYERPLPPER